MAFIDIDGVRLEYELIGESGAGAPVFVFLHEGLGSIGQWHEFPQILAQATSCNALVYARRGHGNSDPVAAARTPDFMHVEALETLPRLLAKLKIARPILFGHSDGASIALSYAGSQAASGNKVRGLIAEAPHVFVEDRSVEGVEAARAAFRDSDLRQKLARYHNDVSGMFRGWNEVWLSAKFRDWNIKDWLPGIRCPVLAIQGEDDAYGTMAQVDAIAAGVSGEVSVLKLADCGHAPHREQAEKTMAAAVRFVRQLPHQ